MDLQLMTPFEVLNRYRKHHHTLSDTLASRLEKNAHDLFCIDGNKSYTWQEFAIDVQKTTQLLQQKGITPNDRVGIMSRNQYTHVVLLFALGHLSAILVPINPEFSLQEASYVLAHAELSGLVFDQHSSQVAQTALQEKNQYPWLMALGNEAIDEIPSFKDLCEQILEQAPSVSCASENDTCIIIYTSGTTGFPKGAMHSQKSYLLAGEAYVARVHLQPNDRVMIVLPMFHINALFYSVSGVIASGCAMIIIPKFSASEFWRQAKKYQATVVNIIEAAGNILKIRDRSEFVPDHHFRCIYGVRQNAQQVFKEEFKISELVSGYGMTEIPGVLCSPFQGLLKPGSMGIEGRHPSPNQPWAKCRIVDESGQDVPKNTVGELIVQTPIVTQGYFKDPAQTAQSFRDGWFLTGDLVSQDEDGYYYFVSRKKDIIRRRGENISGAEIDRIVGEHPAVAEVAAIAVPAKLGEDEILVVIVLKPDQIISPKEIGLWCAARLSAMKIPRYVVFTSALPYTPTNKISKALLRANTTLIKQATDLQNH